MNDILKLEVSSPIIFFNKSYYSNFEETLT